MLITITAALVAVAVARHLGAQGALAQALATPLRSVQRLCHVEVAPEVLRAVRGQWRLP